MREGDTLVVPKLDRLARSVSDARAIADRLQERGVKLALGRALYDPDDPMGKLFFNILATFAEFEADLIRMRTREGMAIARARGEIARQATQTVRPTAAGTLPHACHRRVFHQPSRRTLLRLKTNRLSHTQPAPFPLAYDPAPYRNRPELANVAPHFVKELTIRPLTLATITPTTIVRVWPNMFFIGDSSIVPVGDGCSTLARVITLMQR